MAEYDIDLLKSLIAETNDKYKFPTGTLTRLAEAESSFDPDIISGRRMSSKGAKGMFQFMDATAAERGLDDPFDPEKATEAAGSYLSDLRDQFGGDMKKAIAAYNWGPGNVEEFGLDNMPEETRNYLDKVFRMEAEKAIPWDEFSQTDFYSDLDDTGKEEARTYYFDKTIAPLYPPEQQEQARTYFDDQTEPRELDVLGAAGQSIDVLQMLMGKGTEAVGGAINFDWLEDLGRGVAENNVEEMANSGFKQAFPGTFREQKGFADSVGWIFEGVLMNSAPSGFALAGTAAAMLTAPLSVPLAAVFTLGTVAGSGLMGAGEVASELEEKGLEKNDWLSVVGGAIIGLLDRFGAGKVLSVDGLAKMTVTEAAKKLVKAGKPAAAKALVSKVLKKTAIEMGTEVLQEGVSMGAVLTQGGEYTADEIIDRVVDTALITAPFGAGFSAPGAMKEVKQAQQALATKIVEQEAEAQANYDQGQSDILDGDQQRQATDKGTQQEYDTHKGAEQELINMFDQVGENTRTDAQGAAVEGAAPEDRSLKDLAGMIAGKTKRNQEEMAWRSKPEDDTKSVEDLDQEFLAGESSRETQKAADEKVAPQDQMEEAGSPLDLKYLAKKISKKAHKESKAAVHQPFADALKAVKGGPAANRESILEERKVEEIEEVVKEAAHSPENALPEPTEAQKDAGNYKKGHIKIQGMDIAIENPKDSTRSGVDEGGQKWSVNMNNHYGYLKRSEGADGDQVDVFVGDNPESDKVFVVDQKSPTTGKFDEHKVMIGFKTKAAAKKGYLSNYAKGWAGISGITEMSTDGFKAWMKNGDTTKPIVFAKKPVVKKAKSNVTKKVTTPEVDPTIGRLFDSILEDKNTSKKGFKVSGSSVVGTGSNAGIEVSLIEGVTAGKAVSGDFVGLKSIQSVTAEKGKVIPQYMTQRLLSQGFTKSVSEDGSVTYMRPSKKPLLSLKAGKKASGIAFGKGQAKAVEQKITSGRFGRAAKKMIASGNLKVVDSVSYIPTGTEPFSVTRKKVQGAYDRKTGVVYMVAENLSLKTIEPVMLHEIGVHKGLKGLLGDKIHGKLMGRLDALKDTPEFVTVGKSIPKNTSKADMLEELAAYAVEQYASAPDSLSGKVKRWVEDLYAGLRAGLIQAGWMPDNITSADLHALAKAAVRREGKRAGRKAGKFTPKGAGTVLSEKDPTNTPEFKNWFEDSKVVDEDGDPLVVHHGGLGVKDLEVFDSAYGGQNTGDNAHGAFHFTDNLEVAEDYGRQSFIRRYEGNPQGLIDDGAVAQDIEDGVFTEEEVLGGDIDFGDLAEGNIESQSVYLKIENPYVLDMSGGYVDVQQIEALSEGFMAAQNDDFSKLSDEAREAYLAQGSYDPDDINDFRDEINEKAVEDNGLESIDEIEEWQFDSATQEVLENNRIEQVHPGVDGIIIRNMIDDIGSMSNQVADQYIVFDPNNIKSVDNKGSFSSYDDRIMYSEVTTDEVVPGVKDPHEESRGMVKNLINVARAYQGKDIDGKALATSLGEEMGWWDRTVGTRDYMIFKNLKSDKVHPQDKKNLEKVFRGFKSLQEYRDSVLSHTNTAVKAFNSIGPKGVLGKIAGKKTPQQKILTDILFAGTAANADYSNAPAFLRSKGLGDEGIKAYIDIQNYFKGALRQYQVRILHRIGFSEANAERLIDGKPLEAAGQSAEVIAIGQKLVNDFAELKGYFPQMRYGEFVVSVRRKDSGDLVYFSQQEGTTAKLAEVANAREMVKQRQKWGAEYTVTKGRLEKNTQESMIMDPRIMSMIKDSSEKANAAGVENFLDEMEQKMIKTFAEQSFRKRFMHRKGTPGFDRDVVRAMASYGWSASNYMAKMKYLPGIKAAREAIDKKRMPQVRDMLAKDIKYVEQPGEEYAGFKSFMFAAFMGLNVKSALVNLTQIPLTLYPNLANQYGDVKAIKAITKSWKMVITDKPTGDANLDIALAWGEEVGLTGSPFLSELVGAALGKRQAAVKLQSRAMEVMTSMFSAAEEYNRRTTLSAKYLLEKENYKNDPAWAKGEVPDGLKKVLEETEDVTQFLYAKFNRPTFFRGIGGIPLQFRQFSVNYLQFLAGRGGGMGATVRSLGVLVAMTGLMGLPFADDLRSLIEFLLSKTKYGHVNLELEGRKELVKMLGQFMGDKQTRVAVEYILQGHGALLPVDLGGSLRMGNLIPALAPFFDTTAGRGVGAGVSEAIKQGIGPGPSMIFKMGGGLAEVSVSGEFSRLPETLIPSIAIQNMFKAIRVATEGVDRNYKGKIQTTFEPTTIELIGKAFSFQPSEKAMLYRIKNAGYREEAFLRMAHERLIVPLAVAIADGDLVKKRRSLQAIMMWNRESPRKWGLSSKKLKASLHSRIRGFNPRSPSGVKAKQLRAASEEDIRFFPVR